MSILKFIQKLLKIKGYHVIDFTFNNWCKELWLEVKPHKNGARCPKCNRRGKIIRIFDKPRVWWDVPVCGKDVFLVYRPREINCRRHGRVQENIPWAAQHARVTYRFEFLLLSYCAVMTQKAASKLLKISTSTLSDMLHRTITMVRKDHRIKGLTHIGIDEISYCKGRKYATIVYDLKRSCVLWVGLGKGRETIDRFFAEELSAFQRRQIVAASCDMGQAYIRAIEHWCPKATLVLDRFHVVKALKAAVDEVRKEQWREADKESRLDPIKKFVETVRTHRHRLLPFVENRLTNAIAEGLNRIIKIVKNRASGFRTLDAFSDMIFLTVGDVDIPGQIPARFRTL